MRAHAYISKYIDTGRTHTRACIRTYRWRGEGEEGRESARGHSRRGIHRIRDISRQNQLLIWFPGVGWWYRGRSTSEEPRRAGEVEGRAGEKERGRETDREKRDRVRESEGKREASSRTRKPPGQQITVYGLYTLRLLPYPCPIPPPSSRPRSSAYPSPPADRGWPMKLIIIKSHSVCRGRPPFVRPRVLLTLIRLHPGFITSY